MVSGELRRMIVTGEIEPGQRILAKDVASRFGVSHIPVREAMRRLEGEGLLRYHSQRGAVATDISLAELAEIYDLRRFLECRAAAAAVSSFDDEYVGRLRDALTELERTRAEDPHGEAFFDAHHRFHWLLIAPGCSALVERMLRHLWSAADRYVHLGMEQAPTPGAGRHHRELYRAASDRDGDRLVKLVDDHLHRTEASVLARLQHLAPTAEA